MPRGQANGLKLRPTKSHDGWVFVHPRCATDRVEDLDEVEQMIAHGEAELALEELRWLLEDCPECLWAHRLLGELAVEVSQDFPLARAHFGAGFEVGKRALKKAKWPSPLRYREPANENFFLCGQGLLECLAHQEKWDYANEVVKLLLACDQDDPLQLATLLKDLKDGGEPPIVQIEPIDQ